MQKPRKSNINQWISMMIAYRAYRPIIFRESHLKQMMEIKENICLTIYYIRL